MLEMIFEDRFGVAMEFSDPQEQTVEQEAAMVEVYLGKASDLYGTGAFVGTAMIGSDFVMPYNPDLDEDLRVYIISIGVVDSKRSDGQLRDAVSKLIPIQSETEQPTIGISENATQYLVVIGVTGFSRFARLRKVEVSNLPDFSDPDQIQITIYDSANELKQELPRFVNVTRESGDEVLTKYVRVSHSSGGAYTEPSEVLEITFANSKGTGGSTGEFDPIPRGHFEIILD